MLMPVGLDRDCSRRHDNAITVWGFLGKYLVVVFVYYTIIDAVLFVKDNLFAPLIIQLFCVTITAWSCEGSSVLNWKVGIVQDLEWVRI